MIVDVKRCRQCGQAKPVSAFYAYAGRPRSPCKDCWRQAKRRAYREANPRPNFPTVTVAEYDAMLASQKGKCQACGDAVPPLAYHAAPRARGLLCATCLLVLGVVNDAGRRLRQLVAYLNEPDL